MNGLGIAYLVATFLLGLQLPTLLRAQGHVDIPTTRLPAYLAGYNQVPPNQSSNVAVARLSYVPSPFDDFIIIFPGGSGETNKAVTCEIFLPMDFEPLSAGIYGAVAGQNGNQLFPVGPFAVTTNVVQIIDNSQGTVSYQTNITYSCKTILSFTLAQLRDLKNQKCYVQVASLAYPQGELRGQIGGRPAIGNFFRNPGGSVSMDIAGPTSTNYMIEVSTNLSNWTVLTNFATTTNFLRLNVSDSAADPARWFRVAY